MFYLFMFLWFIFGVLFIGGLIYWLVRRKNGKFVLYSFIASSVFLIVGIVINANEPISTSKPTSDKDEKMENIIVDAVQFALIDEKQLIKLLGEPESKDNWNFKSINGQTYKATTLTYDKGNKEFLFIDGKVVRFTFYGAGQKYKGGENALALFGIKPGPNIVLVENTGSALRYQRVNESMKIDEFWLIEDFDKTIGTVKITYDSRYF